MIGGLFLGAAPAGAAADSSAEPAGPPLSAAPPRVPAPQPPAGTLPTAPSGVPRPADADAASYERCMKLARQDPAAAKAFAESWRDGGGAHPAEHCAAVALIGLRQYRPAATRLEALAQAMIHAPASLRADVLEQAGQAWLLADDPQRAYAADGAALAFRPDDPDLLVDRAEAAGTAKMFDKALADLDRVLKAHPDRVDALIYRAAAYRALGRLDPGLSDAEKAVSLAPDSAAALLERGNLRSLKGDLDGARRDWQRVGAVAPGTPADTASRANLAGLEKQEQQTSPAAANGRP
ncbi:MAG: tetratricopeptide repeat protein [Alphaproteobacteria bacterium]|nr:tetratricopeptide repeat protein [Alphaproteobacteria bacterium]MBV9863170.1 tetratricopeptide repeat protein [Alphaproteobacteria bacterium]